jgi:hypothetical protein
MGRVTQTFDDKQLALQMTEAVYGALWERDKTSNRYLPRLLSDVLSRYPAYLDAAVRTTVPQGFYMQLAAYTEDAFRRVFLNPRGNLVKVDDKVYLHQLKAVTPKTLIWVTRQPGATMKHKLAMSRKILSQKKVYSYNLPENRVAVQLYKELHKLLRDACGEAPPTPEIQRFLALDALRIRSELPPDPEGNILQPNNVLMNDPAYSIIWKAHVQLRAYRNTLPSRYAHLLRRWIDCLLLAVAAQVANRENVSLLDFYATVDEDGGSVCVRDLERDVLAERIVLVINPVQIYTSGTVIKAEVNGAGEAYCIIRSEDGDELYCNEKYLKSKSILRDLAVGDRVSVELQDGGKSKRIASLSRKFRYVLTLDTHDDEFHLSLAYQERRNALYITAREVEKTYRMCFSNPERGVSDELAVADTATGKSYHFAADAGGLVHCTKELFLPLLGSLLSPTQRNAAEPQPPRDLALDFTSYLPQGDRSHPALSLYYVKGKSYGYLPYASYHYAFIGEAISAKSVMDRCIGKDALFAFDKIISRVKESVRAPECGCLVYATPDKSEFSQRDVRRSLKRGAGNIWPIWRSICAATCCGKLLNPKERVLVIDTQSAEVSLTLLNVLPSTGESLFEHNPPFPSGENSGDLAIDPFLARYIEAYSQKYELDLTQEEQQRLVQSGVVEFVLANKTEQTKLIVRDGEPLLFDLCYDPTLYKELFESWYDRFQSFYETFAAGQERFQQVLVVGNHIQKELFNKRKHTYQGTRFTVLDNEALLRGATQLIPLIKEGKVAWKEHLPNLSLEVIKDGQFHELQLTRDESINNAMGAEVHIKVEGERLLLRRGQPRYEFPLITSLDDRPGNRVQMQIENPSFPLAQDVEVQLDLRYRYGDENSYQVIITPCSPLEDAFRPIKIALENAEVTRVQRESSVINTGAPNIEKPPFAPEKLDQIQFFLNLFLDDLDSGLIEGQTEKKHLDQKKLGDRLNRNTSNLQALLLNRPDKAREFQNRLSVEHIQLLLKLCQPEIACEWFTEFNSSLHGNLWGSAMSFLLCMCNSDNLYRHLFRSCRQKIEGDPKASLQPLAYAITHKLDDYQGDIGVLYSEALDYVIAQIETPKRTYSMIRALHNVVKFDDDIIPTLYCRKPSCIERMLREIVQNFSRPDLWVQTYVPFSRILLELLRLRKYDDFLLLQADSDESEFLAKQIRRLDKQLGPQLKNPNAFALTKKDKGALYGMSDVAYLLNAYLTGKSTTSLPQLIRENLDDEDS